MVSLPLLSFLWLVLWHVVETAEDRFKRWTKPATCTLLEGVAVDLVRTKHELVIENALLRQQLIVLERQTKHPAFTSFDRGLFVVLASRLPNWKQALLIIKPDTLLKWHRRGFKLFWRHKSQGLARQTRLDEETIALIKRMAVENWRWGTKWIRGELLKLGLQIHRGTSVETLLAIFATGILFFAGRIPVQHFSYIHTT